MSCELKAEAVYINGLTPSADRLHIVGGGYYIIYDLGLHLDER